MKKKNPQKTLSRKLVARLSRQLRFEVHGPWTGVLGVLGNYIDTRVISMVAWAGFAEDPTIKKWV